jgi:phage portal protein BeeE
MFDWLRRLRAARAERKLMAWHTPGRPVWSARDPAVFAREGYVKNAVAYRCVRMIAEAAASAPLRVGPAGHPLARLLAKPNPEQTGVELLEAFFGHLQVSGNAFLEAASLDDEAPTELYILRPDRMSVVPGADGWPIGWEHRVGGAVRRFERDPVTGAAPILHLKLFHPIDDWYGLSPMEAAAFSIDIHNAGGAWNKALIDNSARPSGALVSARMDRHALSAPGEREGRRLRLPRPGARRLARPLWRRTRSGARLHARLGRAARSRDAAERSAQAHV